MRASLARECAKHALDVDTPLAEACQEAVLQALTYAQASALPAPPPVCGVLAVRAMPWLDAGDAANATPTEAALDHTSCSTAVADNGGDMPMSGTPGPVSREPGNSKHDLLARQPQASAKASIAGKNLNYTGAAEPRLGTHPCGWKVEMGVALHATSMGFAYHATEMSAPVCTMLQSAAGGAGTYGWKGLVR